MFKKMLNPLKELLVLKQVFRITGLLLPKVFGASLIFLALGIYLGFFVAPKDFVQGEGYRIIYVHVPAAIGSLAIYSVMFISSVFYLVFRIKIFDILAKGSAPIGALFTLIALVTGSLWGKPMWGTWWIWDARLTSELLLLFLYLGYLGLREARVQERLKTKLAAVLAIIGMIDVPIVHFSVEWWQTLHQGATITRFAKPLMPIEMLLPLILMLIAFGLFYVTVLLIRVRTEILMRSYNDRWLHVELCQYLNTSKLFFNRKTESNTAIQV